MTVGTGAAIFGCNGTEITPAERAFFRDADPFGFILFARNVDTPDQLRRLTAALRDTVGRDAPIFVDQEGGRVQRLRAPHWAEWLPPLDEVNLLLPQGVDVAARSLALRYQLIAAELRAVGIDGNCAPCLDVATDATHPFLKNRCYSADPQIVALLGRAVADGHLRAGVLPVVKHMPGHGRALADTHHDLPTVSETAATLRGTDFAPFRALADLPLAMTAHIIFSAYDDKPATCSPKMIDVIRTEIGFDGLLMTDDLNMQALSGSLAARTSAAIAAGCDIALHCKGDMDQMIAVATAAGSMPDATLARARAALAWRGQAVPVDISALKAEHSGLVGGRKHG